MHWSSSFLIIVYLRYRKLEETRTLNGRGGPPQLLRSDTRQLGSTIMQTMLEEVSNFCDPDIKKNWYSKSHQQASIITTVVK